MAVQDPHQYGDEAGTAHLHHAAGSEAGIGLSEAKCAATAHGFENGRCTVVGGNVKRRILTEEVQDLMRTLTDLGRALRIPVLLLAALALVSLVGCKGATDAPFGSSIDITGPFLVTNDTTTQSTKSETYRVLVVDPDGNPMSGVEVQLDGIFTEGDQITMAGAGPMDAPANLSATITMNSGGFKDFVLTAPTLSIRPLVNPVLTASALTSGGSLTVGTYNYEVAANGPLGGLAVSALASATTTTTGSSAALSWTAVSGSTSYSVYGDNGAGGPLTLVTNLTATTTTYTDIGLRSGTTAPAAGSNVLGAAANTLMGSVMATSGAVSQIVDVNF